MPIPDFQSTFLPMLLFLGDRKAHSKKEIVSHLGHHFSITAEEENERLDSGALKFHNRVHWGITYLKKAGLLSSPGRGEAIITQRGLSVLAENPPRIDITYLKKFPEFVAFSAPRKRSGQTAMIEEQTGNKDISEETPEEVISKAFDAINAKLADEILESVKKCTPAFLEELVVKLVVAMGYGGSREEAGQAIGRSGDEGIDGIINEDKLGLDVIYLQAKRPIFPKKQKIMRRTSKQK